MTEVMVIQGRELHAEEIGLIRSLLANLGFLTNNTRFPVLPRVTVPHLAGHLLATSARRVRATLQHLVAAVARRPAPPLRIMPSIWTNYRLAKILLIL